MKTDAHIKADVTDELAWDPAVNATGIGVAVREGVVTLTGHLDSYAEKHAVERAVHRVAGVRGIAVELDVRLTAEHKRSDSDIAQAAATALQLNSLVPDEKIQVLVENGRVTLTGEVDWSYQLASAEQCVRPLAGVRGLSNRITIKSRASSKDVGVQITAALSRQAAREAKHITVE
ncbi:MAG: BON domain-containing protein, partial [Polaromonas sp.]|nr:BON domain-containing protein [Polaromonas sp.]